MGNEAAWQEAITPNRFAGKTVIVTGAASGIGQATALRIAKEGGRVIAADISKERLDALVEENTGLDLVPVAGDISTEETVAAVVAAAEGRVDALANVAGIMDNFAPIHEVDDELWERVFHINVTSLMRLTRAVVPLMLEAGTGSVVNVASGAGLRGSAAGAAYTASKHAVTGLTKQTALDCRNDKILCSQIDIGNAATPLTDRMVQGQGVLQPDGSMAIEARMDAGDVGRAVVYIANLPLDTNVLFMTVMANGMPFVGRG